MQKQADQTISKKDIAGVRIKYQVRYTVLIGLSKKKNASVLILAYLMVWVIITLVRFIRIIDKGLFANYWHLVGS